MSKYLMLLMGFILVSVPAWAAQPFEPIQPDPVLETWRWRSYPELKGLGLQCMVEDQDGNMWFGVNDGVRIYDGLTWTTYTAEHGLVGAPVVRLCATRDGSVYAGTEAGISRFKDGIWTRVLPLEADQLWGVADLIAGSDGSLWAGTWWGALQIQGETWTFYTIERYQNWIKKSLPQAQVVVLPNKMATNKKNNPHEGLGISMNNGFILSVFPGGPAETAGLEVGDRIIAVDGNTEMLDTSKPTGTVLKLTVKRNHSASPIEMAITTKKIEGSSIHFWICNVFEDEQNRMWFGLNEGKILCYAPTIGMVSKRDSASGSAWQSYTEAEGLREGQTPQLAQTLDGDIWAVYHQGGGRVNRFDGQKWTPLELQDIGGSDNGTSILVTQDGTLWIGGSGGMLSAYRSGKWHFYTPPDLPTPRTRIFDMLTHTDGSLWLAYRGQEAVRFDHTRDHWLTFKGLQFQCETPEGMQWFVSKDEGIVTYDTAQKTWTRYGVEDGLMEDPRRLILTRNGLIWATGSHGDVAATASFNGQRWAMQKHPKVSKNLDLRAGAYESKDGTLWIGGNWSGHPLGGVLRLTEQTWVHVPPPDVPGLVYGIGQSVDGILWFGGEYLSRYDGKNWTISYEPKELSSPGDWIDAMYTTPEGILWLGSRNYGVFQYDGKVWTRYDTRHGLADSRVHDIYQTLDSSIWVSTEKGVSRFDGKTWLTQALHPDLAKNIEKQGLRQTQDGALWINQDGEGAWQTTRLTPDSDPPETEITLSLDEVSQPGNTTLAWTGSDPWRVTPEEDVQFAYRLDKGKWSPFSTTKNHIFQTLPSGEHTFEVKARDQNFNEDPTPAIAHFTVIPPIWQQPWFIGLMIALLGSIGFQTGRVIQRDRRLQIANQKVIEEMEKELQVAHDMQMSLLPESAPPVVGVDLSGICIPANHVGGDYYHYVFLDDAKTKLAVIVADVSGHAMQAATVALRFSDILRYEVQGRDDATEILEGLDKSLKGQIQSNMFVTCGIGVMNLTQNSLTFASAGSPEVYHFQHKTSKVETLGVTGIPLGMTLPDLGDMKAFNSTEIDLKSGDVVVFVSDGIEEACDHTEELYGQERLISIIHQYSLEKASAEKLRDAILSDVRQFLGDVPQEDDLTVVVLRVK